MPTREEWLEDNVFLSRWTGTLTNEDLRVGFSNIARVLNEQHHTIHVLFDLVECQEMPFNAPYLALKSGFMTHHHIGKVAIVGSNVRARILADIVEKVTQRAFTFCEDYKVAMDYFRGDIAPDKREMA